MLLFAVGPALAGADTFPNRPVKIILTHGPGSSIDVSTRGLAPILSRYLGVPVVCENMDGAGGRRAMRYVFSEVKPDGYTIVASAFPSRLIGELLYEETQYSMKDFVHLGSWVGGDYRVITVAAKSPFKTFQDLLEASKKRKLIMAGGGGLGSTSQVQAAYLLHNVGINAVHVPYEGAAEEAAALLGGHADFALYPLSGALRFVEANQMRMLAIHAPKRMPQAPDVPTMDELGYKGVVVPYGIGAWAPPNTPADHAKVLADAIYKAASDPEYAAWAEKSGVLLEPLTAEEFHAMTMEDYKNIKAILPLLREVQ
jgi:tripartite-type tricarboxylate transporter receptor subunit TctC